MDMYETSAIRELNERLAAVNKFDLDALILNRQGILGPSQMKIVRKRILITGFIMLAIIGISIYQYLKSGMPELNMKTYITAGALLLFFFFAGRGFLTAIKNASEKRVESMEGIGVATYTTSHDSDTGTESESYYYEIDGTRFSVRSRNAYGTLINNLRYRVFYLSGSNVLVNIEALEAPQNGQ